MSEEQKQKNIKTNKKILKIFGIMFVGFWIFLAILQLTTKPKTDNITHQTQTSIETKPHIDYGSFSKAMALDLCSGYYGKLLKEQNKFFGNSNGGSRLNTYYPSDEISYDENNNIKYILNGTFVNEDKTETKVKAECHVSNTFFNRNFIRNSSSHGSLDFDKIVSFEILNQ